MATHTTSETLRTALRILGPFAKNGNYYFRVVWPTHSRVIGSKSFSIVNRWSNILQRRIAERR